MIVEDEETLRNDSLLEEIDEMVSYEPSVQI